MSTTTRVMTELPDEHNNSGDDSHVSEDVDDSSNPAQTAGEECDIVDDPDNLVEAKVMLDKKTSQSQHKTNSRANRRKAKADYIVGRPGHRLDVSAEQLLQDQEVDGSLAGWREKAKIGNDRFIIQEGLLYKRARDRLGEDMLQLCVPQSYRSLVLSLAHRPGHLGRGKTTQKVLANFCWPGLHSEVKQLSRACVDCQIADKKAPLPAPLHPLPIIDVPFQRIGMDMVGPFLTTAAGNRFILVVVDYATRWAEAFPLRSTDSKSVADQLLLMFTRVGVPEQILTVYGQNFVSRLLKELYQLLGVQSIATTPYHPATDGLVWRDTTGSLRT